MHIASFGMGGSTNQSVAAKPLDQILIRKIRFGKKNIHLKPKLIKLDPRPPQERNRDEGSKL